MRVIIAGSRTVTDYAAVSAAVAASGFVVTEIVSGAARGVDRLGERWAEGHGVPVKSCPADWRQHGRGAGPVRNQEMCEYAEALVAVWDGKSRGTADMVRRMERAGKPVYVHRVG